MVDMATPRLRKLHRTREGPGPRGPGPRALGGERLPGRACLRRQRDWRGPPRDGATATVAMAAGAHTATLGCPSGGVKRDAGPALAWLRSPGNPSLGFRPTSPNRYAPMASNASFDISTGADLQ